MWLLFSLILNALFLALALKFVASRGGWGYLKLKLTPSSRKDGRVRQEDAYPLSKREQFERLGLSASDIVMLGDSLTDWGLWHEWFGDLRLKNRGIAGDTTTGVLARLDGILQAKPRALFLSIGINDLNAGASVEAVLSNYRAIVERLRVETPETRVHLYSLLPIDTAQYGLERGERILAFNRALAAWATESGLPLIDLYPHFARDGRLDPALTYDGLHLNGAGYARWCEILRPRLLPFLAEIPYTGTTGEARDEAL